MFVCEALSVLVGLKYNAEVLDELDHDLVTDILVLHCFKTWSHTGKEGAEIKKNKKLKQTDDISSKLLNMINVFFHFAALN